MPAAQLLPTFEASDPRTLRGLAHPVRMAIIGLLRREGPLTATEVGERIGQSPASCSFHLRQLAKYGLVTESGGGTGRRRPWRATARTTSWSDISDDPNHAAAATHLSILMADRYRDSTVAYLERSATETDEWRRAVWFGDAILYLTADELAQLGRDIDALVAAYAQRTHDARLRPTGSRHVTFAHAAFPAETVPA